MQLGWVCSQLQKPSKESVVFACSMFLLVVVTSLLALRSAVSRFEEMQLALRRVLRRRHRIAPREAGVAETVPTSADEGVHARLAEVGERVGPQVLADLGHRVRRCDQLLAGRGVDAVEARIG